MAPTTANKPATGIPYYTPAQSPPAGSPVQPDTAPTLFQPLRIRDIHLSNRFMVSPMCQYSAQDGHLTDYHLIHLGQFAMSGAALIIVEATAVEPRGRISSDDSGLWQDSQIAPLRRITDFIHSQGQKAGIQLAHAGRKSSLLVPWLQSGVGRAVAHESEGGWPGDAVSASALQFAEDYPQPRALTTEEVGGLVSAFADRAVIPAGVALFVRISATEWMEHTGQETWNMEQSIRLASLLSTLGVDFLDVSSGGNLSEQKIDVHNYYQVSLAGQIREALQAQGRSLLIGAVGKITEAEMAKRVVQEGEVRKGQTVEIEEKHGLKTQADAVLIAREFLRDPHFVLKAAKELGVDVWWPRQYSRGPRERGSRWA